jgi:tetratricopeptide (TPR) repeat protein
MQSRNKRKADDYRAEAFDLYFTEDLPADQEKLHKALVNARRAVLLDPSYENLAMVASILGEYDDIESIHQALEYCDRAIRLEPIRPDAYASKAGLLSGFSERLAEAEFAARTAIGLSLAQNDSLEILELEFSTLIEILIDERKYKTARAAIRLGLRYSQSQLMQSLMNQASRRIEEEAAQSEDR